MPASPHTPLLVYSTAALELLFCHLSSVILSFLLARRCAVGLLDRLIHDLPSMGHHAGLKDFVIEI
jgi:hypothetical protein